ncbi:hypothetical protein ACFWWM_31840 [Streptomyces sp. NPDC058682]|nr:hypothetical protein [Streptomyces sp. NBC_01214]MCX4801334.1 hypothetical protein [Streptomyces sp. NBC_01214]
MIRTRITQVLAVAALALGAVFFHSASAPAAVALAPAVQPAPVDSATWG